MTLLVVAQIGLGVVHLKDGLHLLRCHSQLDWESRGGCILGFLISILFQIHNLFRRRPAIFRPRSHKIYSR